MMETSQSPNEADEIPDFANKGSYPPLPDLQIDDFTARYTDQRTADCIMRIVYAHRPGLFLWIAEREREALDMIPIGPVFMSIIDDPSLNENPISHHMARSQLQSELRRRARAMYGLPVD
jgi:hypothetical protein